MQLSSKVNGVKMRPSDATQAVIAAFDSVPPFKPQQACRVYGASHGYYSTYANLSDAERRLVRKGKVPLSYFHNGD